MNAEPGLELLESAEQPERKYDSDRDDSDRYDSDRDYLSEVLADLPDVTTALDHFPPNWQLEHAEPRPIEPISDIRSAAQAALVSPLASVRLSDLCGEATRAAIILGVASVELAHALLLPVVDEIRAAGTPAQHIHVLVASAQQADDLRNSLAELAKLMVNVPDDLREQDDLGNVFGVPLAVNYRASEADLLIAITAVQPDLFANYSNAATNLINTATSTATQNELRAPRFLSDAADWHGRLQELPYQRIAEEAARRAGLRFALSALTNEQGQVLAVKAGDPMTVNESLLPIAQSAREADVSRDDYDVAFLDMAAVPQSLFAASAAAANLGNMPISPLMHGGLIVLQAQRDALETNPLAAQNFYDVMAQGGEADGVLDVLNRRALRPGEDRAYLLAKAMSNYRVMVVGKDMDDLARDSAMLSARDMHEAADLAEALAGRRPRALSVARAAYTRPVFNARFALRRGAMRNVMDVMDVGEIDWIENVEPLLISPKS